MALKRITPIDQIADYYKRNKVANIILNTPVDATRPLKSDEEIETVYEKFKIRQYKTREEFVDDLMENSVYEEKDIYDKWKEYQHRDRLIATGQYEDIRFDIYKTKYVKAMRSIGFSEREIAQVERLSLEKFKNVAKAKQFNKEKMGDFILPNLGEFAYNALGRNIDPRLDEYRQAIKDAFVNVGMDFYTDDENIEDAELSADIEKRAARNTRTEHNIKKYIVNKIDDRDYTVDDDFDTLLTKVAEDGIDILRFNEKNNNISLGRLGSIKGKNSEYVRDIYEILKAKGFY